MSAYPPGMKRLIPPQEGDPEPPAGNWKTRVGSTGSMYPTLKTGDERDVERVPFSDVKEGDVVVWRWEGKGINVIHRVKRVGELRGKRYLITQGDSTRNMDSDPMRITEDQFRGRVKM